MKQGYPLPEGEMIALDNRMVELMRHAVLTGELDLMIGFADWLIAEGIIDRPRGNILANAWFDTAIHNGVQPGSRYLLFCGRLVDDGWCTDADIDDGVAERLFWAGSTLGALPAPLYDWMLEAGRDRVLRNIATDHIERTDGFGAEWLPKEPGDKT